MKFDINKLGADVFKMRTKGRGKIISFRGAAKQTGISFAAISRIERGQTPDIDTFAKLCGWLGESPNKYFKQ